MSIEINGPGNPPPANAAGEAKQAQSTNDPTAPAGRPSTPTRASADTFSMTSKASQMQQLEAQIASLPVVDSQRVSEVQHSLATNTMEVNPARVADKMLSFESGLDPKS